MTVPIALSRGDVADYVYALVVVYFVLILIRILLSWLPRVPYNRFLDMAITFVQDVTDPYLNLFRRFIPPVRLGGGGLDLSPIVATFVLFIVGGIVVGLIRG
jgi:YggT family protein